MKELFSKIQRNATAVNRYNFYKRECELSTNKVINIRIFGLQTTYIYMVSRLRMIIYGPASHFSALLNGCFIISSFGAVWSIVLRFCCLESDASNILSQIRLAFSLKFNIIKFWRFLTNIFTVRKKYIMAIKNS